MRKLLPLLFFLFIAFDLFALPRFAVQQGDRCIDCHVNPSGGMARNENGWFFGKNVVGMISPRDKAFATSPKIGENIYLGMDLRTQFIYSEQLRKNDFQDMAAAIYGTVSLNEKIDVVAKYDFITQIYEGYGIARILPNNSYIKAGTFTPNFGIRIDDHTAYTRGGDFGLAAPGASLAGLYFSPYYTETGVELGAYISNFIYLTASAARSAYNGQMFRKDPIYTGRIEFNPVFGRVGTFFGGSYSSYKTPGNFGQNSDIYGFFAGIGYDKFSLMGEYDMASNYDGDITRELESNYIMVKATYRIMTGLESILRYDMIDPDKDTDMDELSRVIVGLEFFPYSFVSIRPQYRFMIEDPSRANNIFVMQFHIWY